jgi:hypothetical protein
MTATAATTFGARSTTWLIVRSKLERTASVDACAVLDKV